MKCCGYASLVFTHSIDGEESIQKKDKRITNGAGGKLSLGQQFHKSNTIII